MVQVNSRPIVQARRPAPADSGCVMRVAASFFTVMRPHSVVAPDCRPATQRPVADDCRTHSVRPLKPRLPCTSQVAELFPAVVLDQGPGQGEQVTLDDLVQIVKRQADPMVGHAVLRKIIRPNPLRAIP